MGRTEYSGNLEHLLRLGEPSFHGEQPPQKRTAWDDYRAMGISDADGPGLIRMACDRSLYMDEDSGQWAALHAWRAISQLRPEGAIDPLLRALETMGKQQHDWGLSELPVVIAAYGTRAIVPLRRFLMDQRNNLWARVAASSALVRIAQANDHQRAEVTGIITEQLKLAQYNHIDLNTLLISDLVTLRASEAIPAIEHAYKLGRVDIEGCGSFELVLSELGSGATDSELDTDDEVAEDEREQQLHQEVMNDVVREYNLSLESMPKSTAPISPRERDQIMQQITSMFKARLGQVEGRDLQPATPKERRRNEAQDLATEALNASTDDEMDRLAKAALALDANCVDAHVARTEATARIQLDLWNGYEKAVAAGERSLGKRFFKENTGRFWGILETRPYMRALQRLADMMAENPYHSEKAIPLYEKLLLLNPNDNQGVRYPLMGVYLEHRETTKMESLMEQFDEESAFFSWPNVFMHLLNGSEADARTALQRARKANQYVEKYLTSCVRLPHTRPEFYSPGGEEEAMIVARSTLPGLRRTPRLKKWIQEHAAPKNRK